MFIFQFSYTRTVYGTPNRPKLLMMIIKVYPDYIKVHYDNKLTRAMIGPMYKVHDDNINVQDDNVNAYENHNAHDVIV